MSSQRQPVNSIQHEMIAALGKSLQKPQRFDMHVRKFRSICVMHGVQIGSDSELPTFLQKLLDDRHLAMDFWAFVGKVSNREGGELSDDQLLCVIVEGISNAEISEVDGGQQRIVDDLRAMLSGVDIHGPEQAPVAMAPFPRKELGSDRDEELPWNRFVESPASPPDPKPRFSAETVDRDADQTAVAVPGDSSQVDESLLRLELTRLLQQYFDHIDKKRNDPRSSDSDPMASFESVAPPVTRRSLQEPATEFEMEEVRFKRLGRSRLVLEPTPLLPFEDPIRVTDDDLPIRIPLEHYSPPPRFGRAPIILMLLLIGAGFTIYLDPSLFRHAIDLVARQFSPERALIRVNMPKGPAINTNPVALQPDSSQPQASASTQSQFGSQQPSSQGTSTPPPPETTSRTSPSKAAPFDLQADSKSNIDTAGAINVSPAVMDRNLIVSRVPAYPELARANRIEGYVKMQALISKDGTVERVHVTEGDSRLRSAAEDAVYKWRYRPYVLNGQPVEVATTVTVNFNLNR